MNKTKMTDSVTHTIHNTSLPCQPVYLICVQSEPLRTSLRPTHRFVAGWQVSLTQYSSLYPVHWYACLINISSSALTLLRDPSSRDKRSVIYIKRHAWQIIFTRHSDSNLIQSDFDILMQVSNEEQWKHQPRRALPLSSHYKPLQLPWYHLLGTWRLTHKFTGGDNTNILWPHEKHAQWWKLKATEMY